MTEADKLPPIKPIDELPRRVDLRDTGFVPKIWDQGQLGSCFPPGTLVRMADGSDRAIEDVRLLERVVTAEGRTGRVMRTWVRDETEQLLRLRLRGSSHLRMTAEHPVLTARGYVKAGDLVPGDGVALTRYLPEAPNTSFAVADLIAEPKHLVKREVAFGHLPGRKRTSSTANALPEKIELNEATGRLFGLWLADGSADGTKVRWTFSSVEADTLVADTISLVAREWGDTATVAHRPDNSINVTLDGTGWSRLFKALFGNAYSKAPSPLLTNAPTPFLEAMLRGWMDGDGCTTRRHLTDAVQALEGVTVSKTLAFAMYHVAQGLGLRPTIMWTAPVLDSAAKTRQPKWTVSIAAGEHTDDSTQDAVHVWREVRSVERESYVGPVYDLEVEGDHSYVAEGVGVHNCTAHGTLGNYHFHVAKQGLKVPMRSRLALYYAARAIEHDVKHDAGAQVRDAIKAMAKGGIDPETEWPYDISKFAEKPPADTDTTQHAALVYFRVFPSRTRLLNRLAQGFPITDGMPVYSSMETQKVADTGKVPMPRRGDQYEGGHCTLTIGYDLDATDADGNKGVLIKRNSWGTGWGQDGYFTLPLAYAKFLSDRWALLSVD